MIYLKKIKLKQCINEFLKNKKISSVFDLPIYKYKNKLKLLKIKKKLFLILAIYSTTKLYCNEKKRF